eukprot:jgi/Mesen1/4623/ME000237S03661
MLRRQHQHQRQPRPQRLRQRQPRGSRQEGEGEGEGDGEGTSAPPDGTYARLLEELQRQPYLERNGGRDHFLVLGRASSEFKRADDGGSVWGSSLLLQAEVRPMVKLTVECSASPSASLSSSSSSLSARKRLDPREAAVPYPSHFHPESAAELRAQQASPSLPESLAPRVVNTKQTKPEFPPLHQFHPQSVVDFRAQQESL